MCADLFLELLHCPCDCPRKADNPGGAHPARLGARLPRTRSAPLPLVGRGWGVGVVVIALRMSSSTPSTLNGTSLFQYRNTRSPFPSRTFVRLPAPLICRAGGHRPLAQIRGSSRRTCHRLVTTTPTPNPSPQGGGEQTEFAARTDLSSAGHALAHYPRPASTPGDSATSLSSV